MRIDTNGAISANLPVHIHCVTGYIIPLVQWELVDNVLKGVFPFCRSGFQPNTARTAGDARPRNSPTDRYVDESPAPTPPAHPGLSPAARSVASGEARRGLLVYVWHNRYPGCSNPSYSSSRCSLLLHIVSGAFLVIRVLLLAPLWLQLRLSSHFTGSVQFDTSECSSLGRV